MSFSQALSGLNAQSENLKILGNNIANSQTVGFKSSGAIFADVFAGASSQVGLGVKISDVRQDFTAGDLETSGRTLDLAVAGDGFYRVEQTSGEAAYTRNGQFSQDNQGYLVNAAGQRLTGYGLSDPNDPFSAVVPGGAPEALKIPAADIPAKATAQATATYNLDASTVPGQGTQTSLVRAQDEAGNLITVDNTGAYAAGGDPLEIEVAYHYSNSFTTFDSLGNERNVTMYYEKIGDNTWKAFQAVDGKLSFSGAAGAATDLDNAFFLKFNGNGQLAKYSDLDAAGNGVRDEDAIVGVADAGYQLSFAAGNPLAEATTANGETAALAFDQPAVDSAALTKAFADLDFIVGDGAEELSYNLTLTGTTQFNNNSVQNTLTQNGYTSGSLSGLEITRDGRVIRIYTNEERRDAGQIVLANFANEEGLQSIGDNAWRETNASGIGIIGTGGTGVFGTIESGVLENSNVDLAKQLVDTIVAQRAYQANSTSISTQDELLQTIINL
ncbi:flagellar hook protein FlgE [Halomonas sp. FeN2]|uniref:Flagellar hook protein FlgE n=1 Tax=Vreelandella neptunia TaxID=115551 RepID=A0ABZ0YLF6_9GAMM|nr:MULTISPECIES: flagellar hook protein FlgE [Halomonas]TDV89858.1 flagellar hook protein FlgE [Halomonas alkaliantarctica]MBF59013.1 flagellar biosynthesis protein FlgE [Halomonas sp.]MDN3562424.1 flagellar hook protein FlgE [Halomonas neptunia]UBR48096.1 flagellar hook protein FlgE [Halomonas sp. FeN2]WQH12961.1 flagellar hook protein FlgE [Halomonas neptunia]|tara:strand:+ start:4011 stop:5510 length:1500 start_codon:yes stop_codon:yes gene_type:complete